MVQRVVLNETSYFGADSIEVMPSEISKRCFQKAFIVSDQDLVKFGVVQKVTDILSRSGVPFEVYDNVKPNPSIENVQTGVIAYKKSGADFIIAIGGGSPIDTAKAVGIIANNPEFSDVKSLEGTAQTKHRCVPIIAIPTTAGTAAEVTINYVITDDQSFKKMVCVDPYAIPVLSIIDPMLMLSMPKGLTAATGMDALTHAIECFITKSAWQMTDMFALQAIELIARHLPKAVSEPSNIEARSGMALAQYIAGMGFSNVGLGIVHSMAHPLGAYYNTSHGIANAVLLPYGMEYNAPATGDKYRAIAKAMGVNTEAMGTEYARKSAIKAVSALSQKVGIPTKLREIGIKEQDLEKLAESAFADVCTAGNPRNTSVAEILQIYKKAY